MSLHSAIDRIIANPRILEVLYIKRKRMSMDGALVQEVIDCLEGVVTDGYKDLPDGLICSECFGRDGYHRIDTCTVLKQDTLLGKIKQHQHDVEQAHYDD